MFIIKKRPPPALGASGVEALALGWRRRYIFQSFSSCIGNATFHRETLILMRRYKIRSDTPLQQLLLSEADKVDKDVMAGHFLRFLDDIVA